MYKESSICNKCICKWLTDAKAPGLLNPMRKLTSLNALSKSMQIVIDSCVRICGRFFSISGQMSVWNLVNGLALMTIVTGAPILGCMYLNRISPCLTLLKLNAFSSNSWRIDLMSCGALRSVERCGFNYEWHEVKISMIATRRFITVQYGVSHFHYETIFAGKNFFILDI